MFDECYCEWGTILDSNIQWTIDIYDACIPMGADQKVNKLNNQNVYRISEKCPAKINKKGRVWQELKFYTGQATHCGSEPWLMAQKCQPFSEPEEEWFK